MSFLKISGNMPVESTVAEMDNERPDTPVLAKMYCVICLMCRN